MGLAALDDVDDAVEATRQFLLPVDAGRWLRLAVVAFFVGGATGAGGGGAGGGSGGGTAPSVEPGTLPAVAPSDPVVVVLGVLLALLLLLGLAYAVVAAVMEFVLVESLRREAVSIRRSVGRYWRGGLRLFGFRVVVGLLAVSAVLGVVGLGWLAVGGPGAAGDPARLLAAVVVGLPAVALVALVAALALGLTTDFVVPVMLTEDTSVLGAWWRFWPVLRAEWREYAVYVVVSFLLRLVAGVAVGAVVSVVAVALAVPLGLVAVAGFALAGGQVGPVLLGGFALVGLAFLLCVLAVSAVVAVPVVTFLRYYALLVLGDTEPDYDLVAERRAAIREETAGASAG